MSKRANWKGVLKVGELTCPVALYTAASTSDRVSFHMLNRKTGHRLQRQFVDIEIGKPVDREHQVKGYETGSDDYVIVEPDDIAAAIPESDKTLDISAFVAFADIDEVYFDKPYYLTPDGDHATDAFNLIREGMRLQKVAALAQTVLFRRMRTVLIRPSDLGLIATTLNFDYEVRSAEKAFSDIPDIAIKNEMIELAEHIIKTKRGRFDPATFDDRYDAALKEVVQAKIEERKIKPRPVPEENNVIDLMEALRKSAKQKVSGKAKTQRKKTVAPRKRAPPRKAG